MPRRRSPDRFRPFAWLLLAFALWLPAAQWVAATHAQRHLHQDAGDGYEPPAQLPGYCGVCLDAAAIGGAAPLPASPPAPPTLPPHAPPLVALAEGLDAEPSLPYSSRAPPFPRT